MQFISAVAACPRRRKSTVTSNGIYEDITVNYGLALIVLTYLFQYRR